MSPLIIACIVVIAIVIIFLIYNKESGTHHIVLPAHAVTPSAKPAVVPPANPTVVSPANPAVVPPPAPSLYCSDTATKAICDSVCANYTDKSECYNAMNMCANSSDRPKCLSKFNLMSNVQNNLNNISKNINVCEGQAFLDRHELADIGGGGGCW